MLDLSDGAPVFGLLREWLAMNRVPTLELPDGGRLGDPADAFFGPGLRGFLAEATSDRPRWRGLAPRSPDWDSSGWDQVLRTLREFVA